MSKWWYVLVVVIVAAVVYQFGLDTRGGLQLTPKKIITGEGVRAPGFSGGGEWLNGGPVELEMLLAEKKVVLVDFWTYSCVNCQRTLPFLRQWWDKYKDKGLMIVGVHSPEFEFEKDKYNVEAAIERYEVGWPVVQDNEMKIWNAYANRFWPAKYLVTPPNGEIVYNHFGEGGYVQTEQVIRRELEKLGYDLSGIEVGEEGTTSSVAGQSPETYLGWQRGTFGDKGQVVMGKEADYEIKGGVVRDRIYLEGKWRVEEEFAEAGEGAVLRYKFRAGEVNLVMRPNDGKLKKVKVFIDDKEIDEIEVEANDLYQLYKGEVKEAELRLEFDSGVGAYAFTFGK